MPDSLSVRSFIGSHPGTWSDPRLHQHGTLEIEVVLEGRGFFEWPERETAIEAGHVIVIPPWLPHRFAAAAPIRFGVIHLDPRKGRLSPLLARLGCEEPRPRIVSLSRMDKDRYERLFREWLRIQASTLKDPPGNREAWMEVLLLFLLEHTQSDLQAMTVTKAADYLRENTGEKVHISDLAGLTGLTAVRFRALFERIYHMSPKQYQQRCRMDEAKWLLSSGDKSVREVAEQIGFSRLHAFSQWFKRVEGVSPSVWRKRQQDSEKA